VGVPGQQRVGRDILSSNETDEQEVERRRGSKRNFLKLILTLGVASAVGSVASMFRVLAFVPPPQGSTSTGPLVWPVVKITNISSLDPTTPLGFNYPLVDTPSFLLKLGVQAENGVGPDSDIVAFSNYCQHLGCVFKVLPVGKSPQCNSSFSASSPEGYCCCHGGQYDLVHGAKVIGGPPPRPVPQVTLRYDNGTGDIYAIGMGAPSIFGHGTPGTTDPALVMQYDLSGGDAVTQATVFSNSG
jgi:arsenite oxidase small subunit